MEFWNILGAALGIASKRKPILAANLGAAACIAGKPQKGFHSARALGAVFFISLMFVFWVLPFLFQKFGGPHTPETYQMIGGPLHNQFGQESKKQCAYVYIYTFLSEKETDTSASLGPSDSFTQIHQATEAPHIRCDSNPSNLFIGWKYSAQTLQEEASHTLF